MPQVDAERSGESGEKPKVPQLGAVDEYFTAVANPAERAEADIEPVGDETEPGEEAEQERHRKAGCRDDGPKKKRQGNADHRPCPSDEKRLRILREIGPGNRQGVQYDALHTSAREPRADHMPR